MDPKNIEEPINIIFARLKADASLRHEQQNTEGMVIELMNLNVSGGNVKNHMEMN